MFFFWVISIVINFYDLIKEKDPFIITNTDRSDKKGTYWGKHSRYISAKINSFGFMGLKTFILQGDKEMINKILLGLKNSIKKIK